MRYGSIEWLEHQFVPLNRYLGDRWGHRWRGSQKLRFEVFIHLLKNKLKNSDRQHILDIGCGMGDFTRMVFSLNTANTITAMDISRNAIKNFLPSLKDKINLVCAGLPALPFAKHTFDGVICAESVCYLDAEKREGAFKEIKRVLKPGGWVFFTTVVEKKKTHYFTVDKAISLFQNHFEIESIEFHNALILSKIEKIPFLAFNKFSQLSKVTKEKVYNPLFVALALLLYFLISSKLLAKVIVFLSNLILGEEVTRSHIMILGRKRYEKDSDIDC